MRTNQKMLFKVKVKYTNNNYNEVFGGEGDDLLVDENNEILIAVERLGEVELIVGKDNIETLESLGTVTVKL